MHIKKVMAREILDSRGIPTVEVELQTQGGSFFAEVPSGTSTGIYEAVELRDRGSPYGGKGVLHAVNNVIYKIGPKIHYLSPEHQDIIDELLIRLDASVHKSRLGANAILAVSIAVCKAGAAEKKISLSKHIAELAGKKSIDHLPRPLILVFEGGTHARKSSDIQEFMIIPTERSFSEGLRKSVEVYHRIEKILQRMNFPTTVGYEGAFPSPFKHDADVFTLILKAIAAAGYKEKEFRFAIDVAASELYSKKNYRINGSSMNTKMLLSYYQLLFKYYPIFSIEDGFDQNDWSGWKELTNKFGKDHLIVGDDFLATNPVRIKRAIREKACNTLLLKINQIGTISESIEAARLARAEAWNIIVSHRSG